MAKPYAPIAPFVFPQASKKTCAAQNTFPSRERSLNVFYAHEIHPQPYYDHPPGDSRLMDRVRSQKLIHFNGARNRAAKRSLSRQGTATAPKNRAINFGKFKPSPELEKQLNRLSLDEFLNALGIIRTVGLEPREHWNVSRHLHTLIVQLDPGDFAGENSITPVALNRASTANALL